MVRQRLVDRPETPAGLALAERGDASPGWPSGGDRNHRRRRPRRPPPCVRDGGRRPRSCRDRARSPPAGTPSVEAAAATPSALAALWRPAVGRRAMIGRAARRGRRSCRVVRPGPRRRSADDGIGRTSRTAMRARGIAVRQGRPSTQRHRRRSGPASQATATAATPGSPTFAMTVLPSGHAAQPPSNASWTAAASAKTSGWSHSALVSTARSGRYASKFPAYSSASTTNGAPRPIRAVAGCTAGDRARQQGTDERRRVESSVHEDMHQPARGRALPVRPCDGDQSPSRGRVGDDLLPSLDRDAALARGSQLRVVRVDRSEGFRDGQPLWRRLRRDVARIVDGRRIDAGLLERHGVRRRTTGIAGRDHSAPRTCEESGRAGTRAPGADHVDAFAGSDRASGTDRVEAGPDGRRVAGHAGGPVKRLRTSSSADAALSRLFPDRSLSQTKRRTSPPSASATAT